VFPFLFLGGGFLAADSGKKNRTAGVAAVL